MIFDDFFVGAILKKIAISSKENALRLAENHDMESFLMISIVF